MSTNFSRKKAGHNTNFERGQGGRLYPAATPTLSDHESPVNWILIEHIESRYSHES
jgi:hypothetical protein